MQRICGSPTASAASQSAGLGLDGAAPDQGRDGAGGGPAGRCWFLGPEPALVNLNRGGKVQGGGREQCKNVRKKEQRGRVGRTPSHRTDSNRASCAAPTDLSTDKVNGQVQRTATVRRPLGCGDRGQLGLGAPAANDSS